MTDNNRCFGGIAILYKNELKNGINILPRVGNNNDYIWLKLDRSFFGMSKHTYLCVAYIPPEGSPYFKAKDVNILELIESDILMYSNEGHIVLAGDLNARTGNRLDFIQDDNIKYNENMEFLNYHADKKLIVRNSQDKSVVCSRGKRLLELCCSSQIRILNGRTIGDCGGKFTCHKYGGSSVVDYIVTSEANLCNILCFQVNDFIGELSDHCSISCVIKGCEIYGD